MPLPSGARVGPFEILGSIGAGGMGEVYRARDPKLDRHVAIKILPELFATDPERLARFEREARTLGSLNHPNIAQIYGVEDSGGTPALVMELVDGEDLSARIARGPLPLVEALPIAKQMAEALDAAHERGIIHRDLKPANIKIASDGTVKVLDFGLAKAVAAGEGSAPDPANSPTLTSAATRMGVILGTAAYMAPEQAKGKVVDKRADIWAFGCVLYEMLTGRSPFASESAAESIGLIVVRDPDWTALPSSVPPAVVQLIRRCMMKDPKQRLRDIGEASFVLANPEELLAASASRRSRTFAWAWWAVGAGVLALAALGVVVWQSGPVTEVPVRRLELPTVIATSSTFAIAPDGTRLAYVSGGHLYVRQLDTIEPRDLGVVPVTADRLFWSPDSGTIGFTAEATIRSVPAGGGPMFTVCRIPASGRLMGIAWRNDSTIVFSVWRDSLYKVPAAGGPPEVLLAVNPEAEIDFHHVAALPDGRLIVGTHMRKDDSDHPELVDGNRRVILTTDLTVQGVRWVQPGFLLFRRTGANEGIWTVPFTGGPIDLAKAVLVEAGATEFDAADEGTLIFRSQPASKSSLVWVNRDGSTSPIPGSPVADLSPWIALSPEGNRAAFVAGSRGQTNVYVRDLASGLDTPLTFNTAAAEAATWTVTLSPSWFPSGDRLLYVFGAVEATKIVTRRADGAGGTSALASALSGRVSPDGRLLVWATDERGRGRLRYASFNTDGSLGEAKSVFPPAEEPDVRWFDVSPDGSTVAYAARQDDLQMNIYLSEFPSGNGRWQVTADGGTYPRFSRNGRELFFLSGARQAGGAPQGRLMAVPLTLRPTVKLGIATSLLPGTGGDGPNITGFDVAADGRFIMSRRVAAAPGEDSRAVLMQNWPAVMQRRSP